MQDLLLYIQQAQENIFKYSIAEVEKCIGSICNELDKLLIDITEKDRNQLNEVLYFINMSLANKDYLFCADILKYEFQPFLEKRIEVEGN